MTEVARTAAPITPRSRGPGHRTNSPLRAPPRHVPLSSRVNSRTTTPRRAAQSPVVAESHQTPSERRGSSPLPVNQMRKVNPSADSIAFEVVDEDGSIRFVSEDNTHRTVSPAPVGVRTSMGSSEIEFHIEPSAQRGKSTLTEKSDIQFFVEPSPSPGTIQIGTDEPAEDVVENTVSGSALAEPTPRYEVDAVTTSVSSTEPSPRATPAGSTEVSVAPTPVQTNMNETQPPASTEAKGEGEEAAHEEAVAEEEDVPVTLEPSRRDEETPREQAASDAPKPAPSPLKAEPKDAAAADAAGADSVTSDVFADVPFDGAAARHHDIDITEDDEDGNASAAGKAVEANAEGPTPNQLAAQQRRRSSFMPTVWDRPWKDPALKGAQNKPPPMAPPPYQTRKHGEHEPWDPKPTAAVRPSGASAHEAAAREAATAEKPEKPWLVNSVLDPSRPRSRSRAGRRRTSTQISGTGETPTVTPRRASAQITPRHEREQQPSTQISPRADAIDASFMDSIFAEDMAADSRVVDSRALSGAQGVLFVMPPISAVAQPPSEVITQEALEWNYIVTQQATLQFLPAQARERERLVVQAAASLDGLKSTDARVTREVYAARDRAIKRTGSDVNGDPLQPPRTGRSRSATPRRARTPTREAFVDRLYPFDSVASQAPDYLEMKRQKETRLPSVLSDDELDEMERVENAEELDDWRDEREILRDERAVLKQQNAELQFHMRRGTNIKGLTDIQPVTPRTPLARKMRKQSTAVDFFGYDRLAELRIKAKEEETALENATRTYEDIAAKAKDWPTRLRSRQSAVEKDHIQAKQQYTDALAALDDTLARARVLRMNLGASGDARGSAPQDVNGTPVPAIGYGAQNTESESGAGTPVDQDAASRSPRPTASRTPRGSAVPMSARRHDSKQLLGAKVEQAQSLVAAAKTREERVTTPRTGRRGRSGSRSARRRSVSPGAEAPATASEYVPNGTPRPPQTAYERLNSHKTASVMNRESSMGTPDRADR